MRNQIFTLLFILLPFVSIADLSAQESPDLSKYMSDAGSKSLLYRGEMATRYNFLHQGTYYAYTEKFGKGMVRFNDKNYYDVDINLNSHLDEVCVKANIVIADAIVLRKSLVSHFTIDERSFVNLKGDNSQMAPGYYEIIYSDGKDTFLYKKISKLYRESLNRETGNTIVKSFELSEKYYLVRGRVVSAIKNKKSLMSLLHLKKKDINNLAKDVKPSIYTEKEVLFQSVLKSIEK